MSESRKDTILRLVVERYIASAEPVGSQFLVDTAQFGVSGATLRNELRDLEIDGLLTHPHTSAGRIPTNKGYRYYVDVLMSPGLVKPSVRRQFFSDEDGDTPMQEQRLKEVVKKGAELTQSAAILAFNRHSVYYTGISHLFAQPEFQSYALTVQMSEIIDAFEARIEDVCDRVTDTVSVLIGEENPFGDPCSLVVRRHGDGFIGFLGPTRMPYKTAVSILSLFDF